MFHLDCYAYCACSTILVDSNSIYHILCNIYEVDRDPWTTLRTIFVNLLGVTNVTRFPHNGKIDEVLQYQCFEKEYLPGGPYCTGWNKIRYCLNLNLSNSTCLSALSRYSVEGCHWMPSDLSVWHESSYLMGDNEIFSFGQNPKCLNFKLVSCLAFIFSL